MEADSITSLTQHVSLLVPDKEWFERGCRMAVARIEQTIAKEMFEELKRTQGRCVLEYVIESWDDYAAACRVFKGHYQIVVLAPHQIQLPTFVYLDHNGEEEWKCPYCGAINKMTATYCGEKHEHAHGCGHPREKERFAGEYASLHAG
jgi:uncharacterized C2H2 Zn-finger protein